MYQHWRRPDNITFLRPTWARWPRWTATDQPRAKLGQMSAKCRPKLSHMCPKSALHVKVGPTLAKHRPDGPAQIYSKSLTAKLLLSCFLRDIASDVCVCALASVNVALWSVGASSDKDLALFNRGTGQSWLKSAHYVHLLPTSPRCSRLRANAYRRGANLG